MANHDSSLNLGIISSLDLFKIPLNEVGIENRFYVEQKPVSAISNQDSPISFYIGQTSNFIDLQKTRLRLTVKLVKSPNTNLAAKEKVSTCNSLIASAFSDAVLKINGMIASSSNGLYPFESYLKKLLFTSKNAKESVLSSEMFFKDTGNFKSTVTGSEGCTQRGQAFAESKLADLEGFLTLDICSCEKLLLDNVSLELTFYRSLDSFVILTETDHTYKIIIQDATLLVNMCEISPPISIGINENLLKSKAIYPFTKTQTLSFGLTTGSSSLDLPNLLGNATPKRMFVCFVDSSAFVGNFKKNPLYFENVNLREMQLYVNSQPTPATGLRVSEFTTNGTRNTSPYLALMDSLGQLGSSHFGIGVSSADFANGYCIFSFKPMSTMSTNGSRFANLRLTASFKSALTAPMTLLIFAEYNSLMTVDSERVVEVQ